MTPDYVDSLLSPAQGAALGLSACGPTGVEARNQALHGQKRQITRLNSKPHLGVPVVRPHSAGVRGNSTLSLPNSGERSSDARG
jgi:hypothetical protein